MLRLFQLNNSKKYDKEGQFNHVRDEACRCSNIVCSCGFCVCVPFFAISGLLGGSYFSLKIYTHLLVTYGPETAMMFAATLPVASMLVGVCAGATVWGKVSETVELWEKKQLEKVGDYSILPWLNFWGNKQNDDANVEMIEKNILSMSTAP